MGKRAVSVKCRVDVRRLTEHALSLDYEAVGLDGLQHVEHTIVTLSALYVPPASFLTSPLFG